MSIHSERRTSPIIVAIVILATALFPIATSGAITPTPLVDRQRAAAFAALEWLRTQQLDDGSLPVPFGNPVSSSCDAILAIASAGQDPSQWRTVAPDAPSIVDYVQTHSAGYATSAAATAKVIVAVVAANRNPVDWGGANLLQKLDEFYSAGAFGSSTIDQAWALLALAAARRDVPEDALATLRGYQLADGGWEAGSGWGSDSNTTGLAVQALVAVGEAPASPAIVSALLYLASLQNPDGGFPYTKPSQWGTDSDANSTATVIQALLAARSNPLTGRWSQAEGDPLSALLSLQTTNGAFAFQSDQADDLLATVQAIPALLGKTLIIRGRLTSQEQATSWLRRQVQPDGSFPATSANALGSTAQAVAALAAAGEFPSTWVQPGGASPLTYLVSQAQSATNPGLLGRLVLALGASFRNPFAVGGRNLVALLRAHYDQATGGFSTVENVWDHCMAVWALRSSGSAVPEESLRWLLARQNTDGGWGWATGQESDTNSTSLAIQTLELGPPTLADPAIDAAVAFLRKQQRSDGGFAWVAPSPGGDDSDANSTAMVIQALWSAGEEPTGLDWMQAPTDSDSITMTLSSPMERLLQFQLGDGSFQWQDGYGADLMATVQAIPVLAGSAGPVPSPGVAAVHRALDWLRGQQLGDGSFPTSFGHPASITCDVALALAASGEDLSTWTTASSASPTIMEYLASACDSFAVTSAATGKLVVAVVAAGQDPTKFGGCDLLARLLAHREGDSFGTTTTDQAWAILALAVTRQPTAAAVVDRLLLDQQPDGGWESGPGWGSDTNTTALALQALLAAGQSADSGLVAQALQSLLSQQNDDGGFPYVKPSQWGSDSDANSTAAVIQALVACGQDPLSARWTRSGSHAFARLVAFQLPEGALEYQAGMGADLLATAQAIPALLGETVFARRAPQYRVTLPLVQAGPID